MQVSCQCWQEIRSWLCISEFFSLKALHSLQSSSWPQFFCKQETDFGEKLSHTKTCSLSSASQHRQTNILKATPKADEFTWRSHSLSSETKLSNSLGFPDQATLASFCYLMDTGILPGFWPFHHGHDAETALSTAYSKLFWLNEGSRQRQET